MMSTNSAGQSAGKQKTKEKEPAKIRYNLLGLKICHEQLAKCKLRMPANVAAFYGPARDDDPLVVLDVKDQEDIHCVMMMRECLHKNILNARVVMKKDPFLLVLVENYTGMLSTYLRSIDPYIPKSGKMSDSHMIPSSELQLIVAQILDGLFTLWKYGKYHGNFKLENTCYLQTQSGDIIPKITSFKDYKGKKLVSHYQAGDVRSVGNGLTEISEIAKDFNNKEGYLLDCFQIEHLAQRLKTVSPGDLYYTMEEIKGYPFFWTEVERKFFFVSQVPLAMASKVVRVGIEGEKNLCTTLPWNSVSYNGFLQLMINYRKKNNLPAYDFYSRVNYVQFISGLYTHEFELKHPSASVDKTVKLLNPRLFAILYSLLPRAPRLIKQD